MELILLIIAVILLLLNFMFVFAIGIFLVRFRDRVNNIFSDLIQALEVMWGAIPNSPIVESEERPKTWDEKYEEELEAITRRMRNDSGLSDLPDPGLSWGEPPAMNNQNTDGLSIKDVTKSPMNANRVDRPE